MREVGLLASGGMDGISSEVIEETDEDVRAVIGNGLDASAWTQCCDSLIYEDVDERIVGPFWRSPARINESVFSRSVVQEN